MLKETRQLIESLDVTSQVHSDHYTNYVNAYGKMPGDREKMLKVIDGALKKDESAFRPVYVGTQ